MFEIGISITNKKKKMSYLKEIKYLFIDGGYLEKVLESISQIFFNNEKIELKYQNFGAICDKVFYYDALPIKKEGESEEIFKQRFFEKESFLNNLKLLDKFHVYEGVVFNRKNILTQKAVDVMIAVDMLRHSFRKNMNKAVLLTGDMDFKPLLEALIQEGMHTTLFYYPKKTSKELLYVADSSDIFSVSRIYNMTTENFKQKHPAPTIFTEEIKVFKEKWETHLKRKGLFFDKEICLFQNNNDFAMLYYNVNTGRQQMASFKEEKMLINWIEYEYNGIINWDN